MGLGVVVYNLIIALRRQRQWDLCEWKASLVYIVILTLSQQNKQQDLEHLQHDFIYIILRRMRTNEDTV